MNLNKFIIESMKIYYLNNIYLLFVLFNQRIQTNKIVIEYELLPQIKYISDYFLFYENLMHCFNFNDLENKNEICNKNTIYRKDELSEIEKICILKNFKNYITVNLYNVNNLFLIKFFELMDLYISFKLLQKNISDSEIDSKSHLIRLNINEYIYIIRSFYEDFYNFDKIKCIEMKYYYESTFFEIDEIQKNIKLNIYSPKLKTLCINKLPFLFESICENFISNKIQKTIIYININFIDLILNELLKNKEEILLGMKKSNDKYKINKIFISNCTYIKTKLLKQFQDIDKGNILFDQSAKVDKNFRIRIFFVHTRSNYIVEKIFFFLYTEFNLKNELCKDVVKQIFNISVKLTQTLTIFLEILIKNTIRLTDCNSKYRKIKIYKI